MSFPALLLGGFVLATPANHQVRLQYETQLPPAWCPSERAFQALVAARLGYDPFSTEAPLTARVTIALHGGRLSGKIELVDATEAVVGSKHLDAGAGACQALAESLALALAIAVDPQALLGGAPRPVEGSQPPEGAGVEAPDMEEGTPIIEPAPAPPTPAAVAKPPAPAPPPRDEPARLAFLGGGAGSTGLLPAALSAGATLEADLRLGQGSLALDETFFPSASMEALGGTVSAALEQTGISGCWWFGALGVCARTTLGVLRAEGRGYVNDRSDVLVTATLGAAAVAEWSPARSVVLRARASAGFSLARGSILVGGTEVWRSADVPVDGALLVGWVL